MKIFVPKRGPMYTLIISAVDSKQQQTAVVKVVETYEPVSMLVA
jgi:hypothetical protein